MFEKVEEFSEHYEVRWNIGEFLRHQPPARKPVIKERIRPCTVNTDVDLHRLIATTPNNKIMMYRAKATVGQSDTAVKRAPNIITPWYLSKDRVQGHLDRMGFEYDEVIWQTGTIFQQTIYPLTFPHEVMLQQNDKGFFGRIELHPELTGREDSEGKIFFPDIGSRKHVCEGVAVVSRIFERTPTYGFMKCEMKKYEAPSDKAITNWLLTDVDRYALEDLVVHWERSIFGEYIRVVDKVGNLEEYLTLNPSTSKAEINHNIGRFTASTPGKINSFHIEATVSALNVISLTKVGASWETVYADFSAWKLPHDHELLKASRDYDPSDCGGIEATHILKLYQDTDAIMLRQIRTKYNTWIPFVDIDTMKLSEVLQCLQDKNAYDKLTAEIAMINTAAKSKLIACGRLNKEDR
ncbi:MAG: hypothetical protein NC114_06605 [Ruminococcus flavefaciens]|nr:hypothetical protein [Ruminococcus flavefaciens]